MDNSIILYIQSFIVFLFGLTFGSFFNVVIYRLPLGISIINPPSHCPNCRTRLKARHNVPVFSYFFLKGMCSYCGFPISMRYPAIEFITGILFLIFYRFYYFDYYSFLLGEAPFDMVSFLKFAFTIVFYSILLIVSLIDLDLFIIPDSLSISGSVLFILLTPLIFGRSFSTVLLGSLSGFFFYFILWFITQGQGVGLGDAKLMAMIGAFFGISGVFPVIFLASLIGTIFGLSLIAWWGKSRKTPIPFGPFLALGSFVYFFLEDVSIIQLLIRQ